MGRFDGKVALVTGAARGQGASHAASFAREGADVILVDHVTNIDTVPYDLANKADLDDAVAAVESHGRRALGVAADVRSQVALDAVVAQGLEQFGHIDVLVANAGIWSMAPVWEITDEQWQDMIDVNLTGVFRTIKAVAPHMMERLSGSIVVTSSANGLEPAHNYAHYVASKFGVIGLAQNAALELGPFNVRVNVVAPGVVDTKLNDWQGGYDMIAGHPGGTPEDRVEGVRHWPVLRGRSLLTPQSISNAVLWLASDDAADISGITVPVDGGHCVLPGFNHNPVR
ncbi:mycofactocin-coupled SDR family oxidoreductase [Pseudonocardia sp.]|uniref:mycofactocin-coupled SDR family oxidoreductase n=1 Tax=Pseudonocardia sp. TaxID=60912 RepID=UPI003D14DAD7